MKSGKRHPLRGLKRIPFRLKVLFNYARDLITYRGDTFKNIEMIRNKHKGETIFLAGTGPSLDTYPDSFLDDKISMTLHLSYLKFPNPTYAHIVESDRIEYLINKKPDFFKTQGLYTNPFFPLVHPSSVLRDIPKINNSYFLKYSPRRLNFEYVEKQIRAALKEDNFRYQSNSTCLHTGIWCSLILGFQEIILIGCDHSSENTTDDSNKEKHYFSSAQVSDKRKRDKSFIDDAYYKMNVFTNEIIKVANEYSITIRRIKDFKEYQSKTFDSASNV